MNDVENGMNEAGEEHLVFVNTQDCLYQCDTVSHTGMQGVWWRRILLG